MFLLPGSSIRGIPMILKSASVSRIRGRELICILTGILTALLIALIPQGMFAPGTENTPMHLLFQLAGGFIIAVALVLPGISASQMLYMLGIYESTLKAISSLDILALLPLAVGGIMGTYLTARILEQLIKKHREATFLMILGFMLASLPELLPGHLAQGKPAVLRDGAGSRFYRCLFCYIKMKAGKVTKPGSAGILNGL